MNRVSVNAVLFHKTVPGGQKSSVIQTHGVGLLLILMFLPHISYGQPPRGGPPLEAFTVCQSLAAEAGCSFATPFGQLQGHCQDRGGFGRRHCVPSQHMAPGMIPQQGQSQPPNTQQTPSQEGWRQGQQRLGNSPNPAGIPDRLGTNLSPRGSLRRGPPGYQPQPPWPDAIPRHNRVPDTRQVTCFDNRQVIPCPKPGAPFFGQDAHYRGPTPQYRDKGEGTLFDPVTGLLWQKRHNPQRINQVRAAAACRNLTLAGYRDWRLPTIKELFSIADFSGATGQRYFIPDAFDLALPDAAILRGDPYASTHHVEMMGQTWSSTPYLSRIMNRSAPHAFFFNFLDGHLKTAPIQGRLGLFYRCVRGEEWGKNQFVAHQDGTVTDQAMGLMWQQSDDGQPKVWQAALAYCEQLQLAEKSDWRLPNIKELQTLVDYRRYDPAIDRHFFRQQDKKGWFWSSTTHGDSPIMANYLCFGQCTSVDGIDVHGAGAQRSDPKIGNPKQWGSLGGQRDEVRIRNYARCVRDAEAR